MSPKRRHYGLLLFLALAARLLAGDPACAGPDSHQKPLSVGIELVEPTGSKAVIGGRPAGLRVLARNESDESVERVRARVKVRTDTGLLAIPSLSYLGDLAPRATRSLDVAIRSAANLVEGTASIAVTLENSGGDLSDSLEITLRTAEFRVPDLGFGPITLTDARGRAPEVGKELVLLVSVANRGNGAARGTRVVVEPGPAVDLVDAPAISLGEILPGEIRAIKLSLFLPRNYGSSKVPMRLRLEDPQLAAPIVLDVAPALNQHAVAQPVVAPAEEAADRLASLLVPAASDVDRPIASPRALDRDAVGVIIGIERYGGRLPPAPFAARDAAVIRHVFQGALGIPAENMVVLVDDQATKGGIQTAIESLLPAMVVSGRTRLYFYFAGHGAPDPDSKAPYLVPLDGNPAFAKTSCYPLASLYEQIALAEPRSAVVLLDASFNGMAGRTREVGTVLAQARPLIVESSSARVPPNVTVIAAAEPNQASAAYPEVRHGLFTYFLAKALRENPAATGDGLFDYVKREVPKTARKLGRTQSPALLGEAR